MKKSTHRGDVILLFAVLAIGGILGLVLFFTGQQGATVQVRVAGAITASYSLEQDGTYLIDGVNGGTNLLIIEEGHAEIKEASCPDALCVHSGSICLHGQSIVCLPNQVVVEVVDQTQSEETDVDIIAG